MSADHVGRFGIGLANGYCGAVCGGIVAFYAGLPISAIAAVFWTHQYWGWFTRMLAVLLPILVVAMMIGFLCGFIAGIRHNRITLLRS